MERHLKSFLAPFLLLSIFPLMHLAIPNIACAGNLEPIQPPTQGTMRTLDEVYNSVTNSKTIVSANVYYGQSSTQTAMVVPANKIFVLTDFIGIFYAAGWYYDVSEQIGTAPAQLKVRFYQSASVNSTHLRSGIPFSPGSAVIISNIGATNSVTISGYLVDAQ